MADVSLNVNGQELSINTGDNNSISENELLTAINDSGIDINASLEISYDSSTVELDTDVVDGIDHDGDDTTDVINPTITDTTSAISQAKLDRCTAYLEWKIEQGDADLETIQETMGVEANTTADLLNTCGEDYQKLIYDEMVEAIAEGLYEDFLSLDDVWESK